MAATISRGQPRRLPLIGFLNGASYELSSYLVREFHEGLAHLGYVEGRNVAFEYRTAQGKYDRLPALAADLVKRNVDLIAATGTPTGLPAKAATSTIPIVFVTGSDPIEQGLVTNLSHPGGNITGATTLAVEMGKKRMELLYEVLPQATKIGLLVNPRGPNLKSLLRDVDSAARSLHINIERLQASNESELEAALQSASQLKLDGLVLGTDTFFNSQSTKLGAMTRELRLPAVYQYREFVAAGGLMSYGGSIKDAYRTVGMYAGRILKGEKPGDLPVQQSARAELFINASTAKICGLTIPPSVALRADEVI
jgi:ABC-type uncharacterized transport system substrate-binding protein